MREDGYLISLYYSEPGVEAKLHAAGMPALDVIRAMISNAAEMLGWQDRIGSVEPVKFGDPVAVNGNPQTSSL